MSAVRALVTDVHVRSPLHGLRGLGRAGIDTVAVAPSWSAAGLWSRFAWRRAVAPAPGEDGDGVRAAIAGLAGRHGPLVVFPGNELAVDALSADRSWLPPGALLGCADHAVLERLRDKASLTALGAGAGLHVPGMIASGTAGELRSSPPPTPCVLKPARPSRGGASARVASDPERLEEILGAFADVDVILVQEHVAGPLMSLAVVLDREGRLLARFQQLALRTFPADAGVSALAVSVRPDEELVERVTALLRGVGFWGLAQLQFLVGGGAPALIDVNPRFFGSLSLALACGVNLPAAWHAAATGEDIAPFLAYPSHVRYRWAEADMALAVRARDRRMLRPADGTAGGIWAPDDPLPSAILAVGAVGARVASRFPRG